MTDSTDNARGLELLPCPFCGDRMNNLSDTGFVVHQDQDASKCPVADRAFLSIAAWNRRVDLAPDSTDNARGPERIWATGDGVNGSWTSRAIPKSWGAAAQEYIRAERAEAALATARRDALEMCRDIAMQALTGDADGRDIYEQIDALANEAETSARGMP